MTDLINSTWHETDNDNTSPSPNGVQGGYSPSTVGPILRAHAGALKRFYVQSNAIYTTTGTGAAYVLTYEVSPETYSKGILYRFWAHADNTGAATININGLGAKSILSQAGAALTPGQIKANRIVEVVYNGTNFTLLGDVTQDAIFTGTTSFVGNTVIGNANTDILTINAAATFAKTSTFNANTLFTANATFTSAVSIAGTVNITGSELVNTNGSTLSIQRNNTNAIDIEAFQTSNNAIKHSIDLNRYGGAVTIAGSTVWHAGNDGAGSTLDADLLDGQQGSFYQNATNLNAGTIADARLPATMTGKTFTGNIVLPQFAGTNQFESGTADGASYTNYNIAFKGHWGMGMKTYDNTVNGYYDFRAGKWDTKGGFFKNGVEMWHAGNDGAGSGLDADVLDGQSGAYYLARANHTGTQAISTIVNLQSTLDGKQASLGYAPVNRAGDTMTAALTMNYVNPLVRLTYPGVRSWYVQALSDGRFRIVDESGGVEVLSLGPGQQYGQLDNYVNSVASTQGLNWANNRVSNMSYRKVSQGNTGTNNNIDVGGGTCITGYQRDPGGNGQVAFLYYKSMQIYDPVRGWVGFGEA